VNTITKSERSARQQIFLSDTALLWYLALTKLIIHLAANIFGGYGYFRDELYYIACSDHMAWGYVDQPPFSIAALWVSRLFFGDSLFALHLFPACAGAVVVALTGLITKELGGKRYAQVLASLCVIVAPLTLGMNSYFSMNSFDILFWTVSFYLLIIALKKGETTYWLLLGVILGLGLLNKISVLWLGAGMVVGLFFTSDRRLLLTKKAWSAVLLAFALFLPHILWQVKNDFPTLEFIKNATSLKYVAASPFKMLSEQILNMNPISSPLWIGGLFYFLVARSARQYRILPLIYLAVFLILVVNRNSKSEYMGPMFPMLFALGAFAFEQFLLKTNWQWLKPTFAVLLIFSGMMMAPFALSILPVETFIRYSEALGMKPSTPEKKQLSKLPQFYADMFGWEKMTASVADAYHSLSPEEQTACAIYGNNYGAAGAIDFFGRAYGLPKAISGHNNYWLWGPHHATGKVVIRLGGSIERMKESYRDVTQHGIYHDDYCMPYENDMPVWICKQRISPLQDDWPDFKHFE
jgi:hypothetical protein